MTKQKIGAKASIILSKMFRNEHYTITFGGRGKRRFEHLNIWKNLKLRKNLIIIVTFASVTKQLCFRNKNILSKRIWFFIFLIFLKPQDDFRNIYKKMWKRNLSNLMQLFKKINQFSNKFLQFTEDLMKSIAILILNMFINN